MERIVFIVPLVIAIIAIIIIASRHRRSRPVEGDRTQLMELANRWQPPAPLATPTPRPVRLTGRGKLMLGIFLVMTGVMLVFSFTMSRSFMRETQQRQALERAGVVTDAEVVRKREVRGSKSTHYHVTYRFQTAEGARLYHQRSVPRRVYENLREGDRVRVRYLREEPQVNELVDAPQGQDRWLLAALPAVSLGMLFIILGPLRQQKHLLQWGRPTPGVVTRITSVKGGKAVRYQFLDATGNLMAGSSTLNRDLPNVGDTVAVIFEADRPHRNSYYPMPLFRVEDRMGNA